MEDAKAPDLTKSTASEWLLATSSYYDLLARTSENPEVSLVPKKPYLPNVAIQASQGPDQPVKGSLSVGSDLLSYRRSIEDLPKNQGGPWTTDTIEGGVGPLRGFYQKSGQTGNPGSRTTAYGTNLNFNLPGVPGTVTGGLSRQFATNQTPVSRANLGYEGRVGSGILGLQANLTDVRNVGTDKSVQASYNRPDPFGLGGNLSATGSYNNPLGGKSAVQAGLNYGLRFGGGR